MAATSLPGRSLAVEKGIIPATSLMSERVLDLHAQIKDPVIIEAIEVLRTQGQYFVRSTSRDGVTGVSVGNIRFPNLISILEGIVIPFFTGKDARDLEDLVDGIYLEGSNYKYAGLPFWSPVGQVEWSLLDLLGKTAGKPAAAFFGDIIRTEVPVYLSTFTRDKPAQESLDEIIEPIKRTGVNAVKLKIGGRMGPDVLPGRSEALIPLARQVFGDDMVLFADANGSYGVEEGIRMGRLLEAYEYAIVEEPCSWEDFISTKQVTDALSMTVAGGEQDTSLPKWKWMIENRALDLVQPDLVYNGGFIRATRIARMAAEAGLQISPHAPSMGPEAAVKFQFAAVTPNLGEYQEHREESEEETWFSPVFMIRDGKVQIPTGAGLGITYDTSIWNKAEKITCGKR